MYLTRWFCLQDSKMLFITQKINQHLFITLHVSKNYAKLFMCICIEASSETQGQIVGARESLNGLKNVAQRKVKKG